MIITPVEFLQILHGDCKHGGIVVCEPTQYEKDGIAIPTYRRLGLFTDTTEAARMMTGRLNAYIKVNAISPSILSRHNAIGGKKDVVAINAFSLDVDSDAKGASASGKRYGSRQEIFEAFNRILPPSMIIDSDGEKGVHIYNVLAEPVVVTSHEHFDELNTLADKLYRWICGQVSFAIDQTSGLERLLRAPGSLRKSGNRVSVNTVSDKRYTIDELKALVAHIPDDEPRPYTAQTRGADFVGNTTASGDTTIRDHLESIGIHSVGDYLASRGWKQSGDFWTHPNSTSGAPSGEIFSLADGREGITIKSGGIPELPSIAWYKLEHLFVNLEHRGDWKQAARFCHEERERAQGPEVGASEMDEWPAAGQHRKNDNTHPDQKKAEPPPTSPAGSLFVQYLAKLQAGEVTQLIKQYEALAGYELACGQIVINGGPPGGGKTALAMQMVFDGLELNPDLRAVIANAEMSFEVLMRRELTRATRISSDAIRFGNLTPSDLERIQEASHDIIQRLQRVSVLNDPCTLFNLMRLKDEAPGLLVVDYLQKFAPSDKDTKAGVTEVMAGLRTLANAGWAVLCLSATSRTQGKGGSGHDSQKLNQASFRDSGEIEFNADAAYLLVDNGPHDGKEYVREMQLRCVKNRHGAKKHHDLIFHQPRMSFEKLQPVSQYAGDFDDYSRDSLEEAEAF